MKTLDPCTTTLSMAELNSPISNVCFFAGISFVCLYNNYSEISEKSQEKWTVLFLAQARLTFRGLRA